MSVVGRGPAQPIAQSRHLHIHAAAIRGAAGSTGQFNQAFTGQRPLGMLEKGSED